MIHALSSYWQFLKDPKPIKFSKDRRQLRLDFATLLLLNLVIGFLVMSSVSILIHFKMVKEYPQTDFIKEYGFLGTALLLCVVAPLLEETVFRYQLRKRSLSIYFSFLSIGLIIAGYTSNDYVKFFILGGVTVAAISIDLMVKAMPKVKSHLLWQKLFIWPFFLTATTFAYVHISNIKGLTITDPSFVFYIIGQFFGGLSLGYIRLKYGLSYAILFHATYNSAGLILMAFGMV